MPAHRQLAHLADLAASGRHGANFSARCSSTHRRNSFENKSRTAALKRQSLSVAVIRAARKEENLGTGILTLFLFRAARTGGRVGDSWRRVHRWQGPVGAEVLARRPVSQGGMPSRRAVAVAESRLRHRVGDVVKAGGAARTAAAALI